VSESSLLKALERAVSVIHKNCKADNPQCACACGCETRIGCTCWAPVCTDCQMNWMRERDPEPGYPECEPPDSQPAQLPASDD
jgi:hypothetical protein